MLLYALSALSLQDYASLGSKILIFQLNQTCFKLALRKARITICSKRRYKPPPKRDYLPVDMDSYPRRPLSSDLDSVCKPKQKKIINWIIRFQTLFDLKVHHYLVKRTPHKFSYRGKNIWPIHMSPYAKHQS